MKYAIHLSEIAAMGQWHPLAWLLRPFLTEETVRVSSAFDGYAVVVNPDVPGRDWEAAMTVALSARMTSGYVIRIYQKEKTGWKAIRPDKKVLQS